MAHNPDAVDPNAAFLLFLQKARRGDEFTYFVGHTVLGSDGRRIAPARLPFQAYEDNAVSLVQRRVPNSDGLFSYIAQRR
jgi:hypothetical protein